MSIQETFFAALSNPFFLLLVILIIIILVVQAMKKRKNTINSNIKKEADVPIDSPEETSTIATRTPDEAKPPPESYLYRRRKFILSDAELRFYILLRKYLPEKDFKICPQVSFSAIVDKDWIISDNYRRKYNSFFVDFLICNDKFKPICAIELDDPSHRENEKIIERDKLKKLFWESIEKNSKREQDPFKLFRIPYCKIEGINLANKDFRLQFLNVLKYLIRPPHCDDCGRVMYIKFSPEQNSFFWSCSAKIRDGNFHKGKNLT